MRTLVIVLLAMCACVVHAAAYVPSDDAVVLERLPSRTDPAIGDLVRAQRALVARRNDVALATRVAQLAIQASRASGDPRFLGQAQAALGPWWSLADPPPEVLLLRATIRQSLHDFDAALADLDRLIAARPGDLQALLTRATVLTVRARFDEAKRDCAALARRADPLVVVTCLAAARSMSGEASPAYADLDRMLSDRAGSPAIRAWASTLAAEIAERRGDTPAAERHFVQALALDAGDAYAKGAYADFLIASGRPEPIVALLANDARNDALLLRLALAEKALPAQRASYEAHRADLAARFDAARRRGDGLHLREEARHALDLDGDAKRALALARENWLKQKEAADLLILARAAEAAGDRATLRELADWITKHRYEDVRLARFREGRT